MRRSVFVSMTFDAHLSQNQNDVKWGIVEAIVKAGLEPHCFFPHVPESMKGRVRTTLPWTASAAEEAMRSSVGAMFLAQPRWRVSAPEEETLASEYIHYEAGVARTLGLPMFMAAQEGMPWRGAFDPSDQQICTIPAHADRGWLQGPEFGQAFDGWLSRVSERYDVFLGYSSGAEGPARNIKHLLELEEAKVLDWMTFGPGTILEQIAAASAKCTGGVFLFTRDDVFEGDDQKAAPRDNVVFEAGYFVNAKGHRRVLIVKQEATKMPADLGGTIYAPLEDPASIKPIEDQLRRFLSEL